MARVQFDVGINTAPGASELKKLSDYAGELHNKLDELRQAGDWDGADRFNTYLENVESRMRSLEKEQRVLESTQEKEALRTDAQRRNTFQQISGLGKQVGNIAGAAGNGDVAGALEGAGSTAGALGSAAKALAASPVTGLIAAAVGAAWAGNKTSQIWEKEIPGVIEAGTALNENKFRQTPAERTAAQRGYWNEASRLRRGTNISAAEFLRLEKELAKTSDYSDIWRLERDSSAVNYAAFNTGADRNQLLQLAGAQNLYGYKGAEAIQSAYENLKRSGMTDARFDEFLSGIQRVMEEGIEKGFVGSAETVSRNIALISSLSGNSPFWTGANGAERVSRINAGFAGAVDLGSPTDMMMYAAAKSLDSETVRKALGKDYAEGNPELNARMIMEQGLGGSAGMEMLRNYARVLDANSPDDEFKISNIRQSFGLNVTGARQLLPILEKLADGGSGASLEQIQNIINSSQNKTTESQYLDNVQSIHDIMAKIGQSTFDIKAAVVNGIAADVSGIYSFLTSGNSAVNGAKGLAAEVAGSGRSGAEIQAEIDRNSAGIHIDGSSQNIEVENRANASLVAAAAENTGHALEAVKAFVSGEAGITLAAGSNINLNSNILGKINGKGYGDDSLDDMAAEAMYPYLKNKNPFREISDSDIADFFSRHGDDRELLNAYSKAENSAGAERAGYENVFMGLWKKHLSQEFGELPAEDAVQKQSEMRLGYQERLKKYAAGGGGLKGPFPWSGRKIDSVVSEEEERALASKASGDKALISAFKSGDTEAYFARLEQLLIKLFGTVSVENAG